MHGESGQEEFKYTGKHEDSSGLYYFGARYYDPQVGRFITEDPVTGSLYNPQDLNRYIYSRNNPHKYTDPDGKEPVKSHIGSYKVFAELLNDYEQTYRYEYPDATTKDVLKSLVTFSGSFSSKISPNKIFRENVWSNKARYVYTKDDGFVDNYHFFLLAADCQTWGQLSGIRGWMSELIQSRSDPTSSFSYEDLISNKLGIKFGMNINNDESLAEQYLKFMESRTASTNPLVDLDMDYPGASNRIPNHETYRYPRRLYFHWFGEKAIP